MYEMLMSKIVFISEEAAGVKCFPWDFAFKIFVLEEFSMDHRIKRFPISAGLTTAGKLSIIE